MTRTQSERLTLRPVTKSDVDDLFRIYGDPATDTFNPAGPYPNQTHARQSWPAGLATGWKMLSGTGQSLCMKRQKR